MTMKYIKLFESWRLMEAEGKQDSFDRNKPGGWPVLKTTIGDLRSGDPNKILTSVFKRALQTGEEWDSKAGEGLEVSYFKDPATTTVSPRHIIRKSMESIKEIGYNKDDDTLVQKANSFARKLSENFEGFAGDDKKNITSGVNVRKGAADGKFNELNKKWTAFTKSPEYQQLLKWAGKEKQIFLNIPIALDAIKKILLEKEETMAISIGNDNFSITLNVPDIKDTSLNPDDAPISDFVCTDVESILVGEEYQENIKKPKEGDLTLGMVMTWCNHMNKNNESKLALLSNTGKKNYQKDLASIFAGEDAEELTQFAATIKVGGKNLALTNGADGTRVPVFITNTVLDGTCAFDFDKSTLQDSGKKTLESKQLWSLLSKATKSIEIIGHTDSVGKADYNKKLSEQRAQSVLSYLKTLPEFKQLKVQPTTTGVGSTEPIKDDNKGKDENAAALNRRVVIKIDGVGPDYAKLGIK